MTTVTNDPNPLIERLNSLNKRREFLRVGGKTVSYLAVAKLVAACGGGSGGGTDNSGSEDLPDTELPETDRQTTNDAYRLVRRTSFGLNPAAIADFEALGAEGYLEQQLNHEALDDGPLDGDIARLFPLSRQSPIQLWAGFPDNIAQTVLHTVQATQFRQLFSRRQLYEVMVEFWSDHFNIHIVNGLGPTLKPQDNEDVIRAHALGNFGDLLRASAQSPAMLFYLDNFISDGSPGSSPNENYARELMELHTLGVDGGYSEQDILEVARCFSGWGFPFPPGVTVDGKAYGEFWFDASKHDQGAKIVLGQPIAANGGQTDGEQVLAILLNHPSTATFIATKLCRRFIADSPPASAIAAVAETFTQTGGDIKAMLRTLFMGSEFYAASHRKFSRPSEFLGQIVRGLGVANQYPRDDGQLFYFAQAMLGQLPFFWPTPDGYPLAQSYWASTGGLLNRWRLSFLSYSTLIPETAVFEVDYPRLLGNAASVEQILDSLAQKLLFITLAEEHRRAIVEGLETSLDIPPGFEFNVEVATNLAALLAAILISSDYFQYR